MSILQRIDRRRFLQAFGLGAAALGLRSGLGSSRAGAQDNVPLRIVFWYDTVGLLNDHGYPLPVGADRWPRETSWELGPLWAPLAAYKDRMNVITGMEMVSAKRDPTPGANAHINGQTHALTGAFRIDEDVAGGVSINQYIAEAINSPSPVTRYRSMEVAVRQWGSVDNGGTYAPDLSPVPFLVEPPDVYDRFFPPELRASGMDASRQARRRSAIADLVRSEGSRLVQELSSEQRAKVEQHMQTHADLQRRLSLGSARAGNVPDPSFTDAWGAVNWGYDATPNEKADIWRTMGSLNTQMVAAALHADLTRVATVHVSHPADAMFGYTPGDFGSDDWHDLVHKVSGVAPDVTDPTAVQMVRDLHARGMELFASFVDELSGRLEPDGQSLLDHTLIVFCSEIGDGSHALWRLPWATIGDAHGFLRTGICANYPRVGDNPQLRDYGEVIPHEEWSTYNQVSRPHNDLFVTLANAMGIETQTFGEPSVCTGPMSELHA